jgi:hypothetical protein
MPAPIPLPLRRQIRDRARRGQDARTIAAALKLNPRTVQHLLRRFRQQPDHLAPAYRPGPGRPPAQHPLFALALALHQQHPTWGAAFLRLRLLQHARSSDPPVDPATVPCTRTLQRWFAQHAAAAPLRPGRPPLSRPPAASGPHDIWQMDAVASGFGCRRVLVASGR